MAIQAYIDGAIVNPGQTVTDFRGQEWTFDRALRSESFGHSGKVQVRDEFNRTNVFYTTVFPNMVTADSDEDS